MLLTYLTDRRPFLDTLFPAPFFNLCYEEAGQTLIDGPWSCADRRFLPDITIPLDCLATEVSVTLYTCSVSKYSPRSAWPSNAFYSSLPFQRRLTRRSDTSTLRSPLSSIVMVYYILLLSPVGHSWVYWTTRSN